MNTLEKSVHESEPIPFEIWSEGYRASGDSGNAHFHGIGNGKDFKEACVNFFKEKNDYNFNPDNMTYWGCKLSDNETEAREDFG